MISIKQLSYALAVEKTLHFKKAAESCHVSQSALSTALAELEKQLGIEIFERNNKQVLVTPLGKEILSRAREILLQVEDLEHLAASRKSPLSFPVNIGMIPTIAPYLLPKLLKALNENFPEARINVMEDQSHILVDKVRRGEIDTAILALPYPIDGLLSIEFLQENFYWITRKDRPCAGNQAVTAEEIRKDNLMLLKEGHCLKDQVLDVCKIPQQENTHGFAATSLNTLIQMVQGDQGTTLIPAIAKEQLLRGNHELTAIPLNEPGPHRRLAFIFRPNYSRISSIEALSNICKQSIKFT